MIAWHFCGLVDGVPTLRDGRPVPPVGEWLVHDGPWSICNTGLHASLRAIDALEYWSGVGGAVCLVECEDIGEEHADKFVCRRRRVLAWTPCDEWLRLFAREAALSVQQYWTMPPIVREYLESGDEEIRAAARDAARAAAWAARDAARAVGAAARAAAWAAGDAAWAAAGDAARDAAWAGDAARDELNHMLESILLAALEVDLD
jgi:hypothetical protein